MQTRSLYCVPDPGLIYTGGHWFSQGVSDFAPLDGEKKPGRALPMSQGSKLQSTFVFTAVILVGCGKG